MVVICYLVGGIVQGADKKAEPATAKKKSQEQNTAKAPTPKELSSTAQAKAVPKPGEVVHADSIEAIIETELERTSRFVREQLTLSSAELVGASWRQFRHTGQPFTCDGLIFAALEKSGLSIQPIRAYGGGVRSIYAYIKNNGILVDDPREVTAGDLVFFHNTYDRNRDHRFNDQLTHIAVVESFDKHGTMVLIHKSNSGVERVLMNVHHPRQRYHPRARGVDGVRKVINSYLRRVPNRRDYLTGELFFIFGRLE